MEKILSMILVVGLLTLATGCGGQQLEEANQRLAETEQRLEEANQKLAETEQQLGEANQKLATTDQELVNFIQTIFWSDENTYQVNDENFIWYADCFCSQKKGRGEEIQISSPCYYEVKLSNENTAYVAYGNWIYVKFLDTFFYEFSNILFCF